MQITCRLQRCTGCFNIARRHENSKTLQMENKRETTTCWWSSSSTMHPKAFSMIVWHILSWPIPILGSRKFRYLYLFLNYNIKREYRGISVVESIGGRYPRCWQNDQKCVPLINLKSLSIPEHHQQADRSPGPDPDTINFWTCNWWAIENYYILAGCFLFEAMKLF